MQYFEGFTPREGSGESTPEPREEKEADALAEKVADVAI